MPGADDAATDHDGPAHGARQAAPWPRDGGPDGVRRLPRPLVPEDGAAGHEHVGPGGRGHGAVVASIPPSTSRSTPGRPRRRPARTCRHLRHDLAHEALATEAGEHRHAQHEIDAREVRLDRLERRVRIEGESGAQPEAAHLRDELVGVADLDVHRAAVGPGLGEGFEVATRFGHHQVAVEVERCVAAQRGHHGRTDRHVRHEVPVHDVDVEPVGRRSDFAHLLGQEAEVGRQDRGGDAQIAGTPGPACSAVAAPGPSFAAAQLKRAQQRMRLKP